MNHFYGVSLPQSDLIREAGVFDIPTTSGDALRAVFSSPTLGNLVMSEQAIETANAAPRLPRNQRGRRKPLQADKIAPEVLNERYADLGLTFDRPQTEEAARLIAEGKRAELIRNDIIRRAPSGLGTSAAMLAGGLMAAAVDPLEVAAAFVPVVSQARMAGLTARLGTVGGRATAGLIEGTVGAAITEPLNAMLSRSQHLDYTMSDALLNVGLGGLLGGGIGTAAGVAARGLKSTTAKVDLGEAPFSYTLKARPVEFPGVVARQTPEQRVASFRASVAQIAEGKSVDVAPMTRGQRPTTLVEFLAKRGVQDQNGELTAIGAREGRRPFQRGVVREDGVPLDTAAEAAAEAGYINKRDIRELLDAVDEELRGTPRLSREDLNTKGMTKAEADRARYEAEAFLEEFDDMKAGLESVGLRDLEPDEIQRAMEIARRDGRAGDFDHIAERLAIESEAAEVAAKEAAPERDRLADFEASQRVRDEGAEDVDIEAELADLEQMVSGYELSKADLAELDEVNAFTERASAYAETARAAAACLLR